MLAGPDIDVVAPRASSDPKPLDASRYVDAALLQVEPQRPHPHALAKIKSHVQAPRPPCQTPV